MRFYNDCYIYGDFSRDMFSPEQSIYKKVRLEIELSNSTCREYSYMKAKKYPHFVNLYEGDH